MFAIMQLFNAVRPPWTFLFCTSPSEASTIFSVLFAVFGFYMLSAMKVAFVLYLLFSLALRVFAQSTTPSSGLDALPPCAVCLLETTSGLELA